MEQAAQTLAVTPGGGFLVGPVARAGIFTREDLSEDQREFAEATERFVRGEILPNMSRIEAGESIEVDGEQTLLVLHLLREAAEIGLTLIKIFERFGGLELDLTTDMVMAEHTFGCASFAATLGAHCGIGTLPIAYFGSEEQQARYLPSLATAEVLGCYALTEPGNGSDALHGSTTALRSEDGTHFILSGQKQFITNGGWADMAVVFANIDGRYSALIVDLHAEGVSRGAEEKKMGIKGSSTTGLVFQDVKVPVENLLGRVGDAAKIALNILYVGRLKLGFATLGTAKYAIDLTVKFMQERKQFGRPISEFDLQQGKLAEMTAWTYGCDSACYRIVGAVDEQVARLPEGYTPLDEVEVLRRFGLECAIVKINGSETLSRVLYHAVRMHGGYGFCEEYVVERLTRDNVIDTIYEGTNDINRLVLTGALVEAAYMGTIPFRSYLEEVHHGLREGRFDDERVLERYLAPEELRLTRLKRALAWATEQVLVHTGKDIKNEQQVMMALADCVMQVYVAESAFARTVQVGEGHPQASARADCTRLLIHEAEGTVGRLAAEALEHVLPTHMRPGGRRTLARLLPPTPSDAFAIKRRVAAHVNAAGRYDFE